jgi:hypothetical protein
MPPGYHGSAESSPYPRAFDASVRISSTRNTADSGGGITATGLLDVSAGLLPPAEDPKGDWRPAPVDELATLLAGSGPK